MNRKDKHYDLEGKANSQKKLQMRSLILLLLYFASFQGFSFFSKNKQILLSKINDSYSYQDSLLPEDLSRQIMNSSFLTEEEKSFLNNSDFLEDIYPFISYHPDFLSFYQNHFYDIQITSYGEEYEDYSINVGYYDMGEPNVIHIKDYVGFEDKKKDTIAHEFVHLCQDITGYNLLIEAGAEIISNEYYDAPIMSYTDQVRLLKKLMEIIGPEAIWDYNFTGDFSKIEELVKPHLREEDYQIFLNCLTFDYHNREENMSKFQQFDEILGTLYSSIYHKNIEDDLIMQLIDREDNTLVRYYFNERKISSDYSYYYNNEEGSYQYFDLQTAIDRKLIFINAITKTPISTEMAFQLLEEGEAFLYREIDYSSEDIILMGSSTSAKQHTINAIINGEKYVNADVDELVRQGIISVQYYVVDNQSLNAEDYFQHQYNPEATLYFNYLSDTSFDGERVYGFSAKRVDLPTIHERFEDQKQYVLS